MTPIFRGTMSEDGVLRFFNPIYAMQYRAHLSKFAGKQVEIIVRQPASQRSLDQNSYWHAVPVTLMAEYMGEEHMATHYALLGECFGYHWSEKFRRQIPNKGSSSALTVEEFSYLIEWCPPWALTNHGVWIPLPNEVEVPAMSSSERIPSESHPSASGNGLARAGTQNASQRISLATRPCSECGLAFAPTRKWHSFCSRRCKTAAWERKHPRRPLLAIAEGYLAPRPLPEEPEARRDIGKAIAAANNRRQLAKAQELALEYLATHPVAIISDIREFAASKGIELEWWKPWTANVFMVCPWFEWTGVRRKSTHKQGNARKVNEYRMTAAGWGRYRSEFR